VALRVRLTGTHSGTLPTPDGEVPATGRRVDLEAAGLGTLAGEGRVREWRWYYDRLAFLEQLGLVPQPAVA
jgi:hypothetical protein